MFPYRISYTWALPIFLRLLFRLGECMRIDDAPSLIESSLYYEVLIAFLLLRSHRVLYEPPISLWVAIEMTSLTFLNAASSCSTWMLMILVEVLCFLALDPKKINFWTFLAPLFPSVWCQVILLIRLSFNLSTFLFLRKDCEMVSVHSLRFMIEVLWTSCLAPSYLWIWL